MALRTSFLSGPVKIFGKSADRPLLQSPHVQPQPLKRARPSAWNPQGKGPKRGGVKCAPLAHQHPRPVCGPSGSPPAHNRRRAGWSTPRGQTRAPLPAQREMPVGVRPSFAHAGCAGRKWRWPHFVRQRTLPHPLQPKHKPTRTGSVTRPTAGGGNSVALSLSPAGGGGAGGPSPAPESTVKGGGRNAGTSVRGTPPPSPAPPAAPSTARGVKEGVVVQAVRPASRAPPSPFPFPPVHPDWWKPRVGTFLEHLLHTRRADAEVVLTLL